MASPLGLPIDSVSAVSNTTSIGTLSPTAYLERNADPPPGNSNSAWTLLTSATVTDDGVRDQLVQYAWNRAATNKTAGGYPDIYNAVSGLLLSSGGGVAG